MVKRKIVRIVWIPLLLITVCLQGEEEKKLTLLLSESQDPSTKLKQQIRYDVSKSRIMKQPKYLPPAGRIPLAIDKAI